ncbi:MAG: hypothetical protein NTU58_00780 [Candidatus Nealsonbacteria bacterium]|nr:hypothetical protein [Candidatus Nealsonbacteria bacterium]
MHIISKSTSDLIIYIGIVVSIIGSIIIMKRIKAKLAVGQVSQEPLTKDERIKIWILALFNPIWTDIILYFGWRKSLPIKAKNANLICFITFFLWLALSYLIGFPVRIN